MFQVWVWLLSATLFLGNFLYSLFSLVRLVWNWLRFGRQNKRVVIVGGGFAGTTVAKVLQHLMEVHLIDTKEFFEFTPSVLRVIVSPTQVKSIQVMHNNYLKHTTVHHGTVTEIKPEQNLVVYKHYPEESHDTNTLLPYDYLVICSGSSYHRPFKNPNLVISTRAKDLLAAADRVQDAESVVVIGGGTVGVEIAAEIITQYPNKKVSIVHSGNALLSRNGAPRAGAYAEGFFRKHNVQLVLGEKVQIDTFEFEDSSGKAGVAFSTHKGTRINADLAFVCTGMWPNSEFLSNQADSSLGPQRFVKVNSFLQSELGPNVFVCGDVANIQEEKLAQAAGNSASIVSQNILRHVSAKGKLKSYSPCDLPIIVSLGKYDAVFMWKNFTFTGFLPALAKEAVQWKVMITF